MEVCCMTHALDSFAIYISFLFYFFPKRQKRSGRDYRVRCYLCFGRIAETRLGQRRVAALGEMVQRCVRFVRLLFCTRKAHTKNEGLAFISSSSVKQRHALVTQGFSIKKTLV